MAEFETGYQALGSFYDEEHEAPPTDNIIHVVPESSRGSWNHIENLDEFFTRVYQYHQRSGLACMLLQDTLQLLQFAFVVLFSVFLLTCVDYDILFYEKFYNGTHKVTIPEAIYPPQQCADRMGGFIVLCLVLASLFFLFRIIKLLYNAFKYFEMRAFYTYALKITPDQLLNMTWHEVQRHLQEVQREHQMCIHKQDLTELDIYHRILRFKNYMIAMVNKSLMHLKFQVPCVGEYTFLSTALKYNLEMILFWGPGSPFENYWHLKPDYKNYHKRKELADQLSRRILWVGIANFLLCPLIFLWQILYSFFRYAESIKREPGSLGSRRWSLYARLYLRHFNELDHEFNARLNRGYKPAEKYMNIFLSPLLVVVAKHCAFFAGSILAVFVILTVIDEDILYVQNVIGVMTVLGIVLTICHTCIPDEHMVWCPELLMKSILAQIHYIPDSWKGNAHTFRVRDEFAHLFQFKAVYLLEELLSPIITPMILCFSIRYKALEIVDFYRNFTVEVTGVGDVCSFAQMDVRRHGNPQWAREGQTEANQYQQAEDGKTELSLMHFTLTNPEWKPPQEGTLFIQNLKEQAVRDAAMMSFLPPDNPLINSLHSMSSIGYGYNSMISSIVQQSTAAPGMVGGMSGYVGQPPVNQPSPGVGVGSFISSQRSGGSAGTPTTPTLRGGLRNAEGPMGTSTQGLLASVQTANIAGGQEMHSMRSGIGLGSLGMPPFPPVSMSGRRVDEETLEMLSTEMSFSALYMHELHHRRIVNPYFDNLEDMHERAIWQPPPMEEQEEGAAIGRPAVRVTPRSMSNISEQHEEEELEDGHEITPLLDFPPPQLDSFHTPPQEQLPSSPSDSRTNFS